VAEHIPDRLQKHPLEDKIGTDKALVAKVIEETLISKGITPRLARAATINAYAESKLNPIAVGDHGRAVGVFQLHSMGMGNKMSHEQRVNVRTSAERVALALAKDEVILKMQDECASMDKLVSAFAVRIMRPSNKMKRARERVVLSHTIQKGLDDECTPVARPGKKLVN
jgi:hypothetical protein